MKVSINGKSNGETNVYLALRLQPLLQIVKEIFILLNIRMMIEVYPVVKTEIGLV